MKSPLTRFFGAAVVVAALMASGGSVSASGSLFELLRHDDIGAIKAAVAAGAPVNAADDTGATPLMYAALYGSPDTMRVLLDKGAQVNAINQFGATALMWAAPRTANVAFLLDHGADVNARATNGFTALVAATRYGNVESMKLLIAKGADLKAQENRTNLLTAAHVSTNPATRTVLKDAHLVVLSAEDVKGPVLAPNMRDPATFGQLLNAGVDPGEQLPLVTLSLPVFFIAAREGQVDAMVALTEAGFDPNEVGPRGWTALMLAAGSDNVNIAALKLLIKSGAELNALDEDGRTALDWALTRGETPIAGFLRSAGAVTHASVSPEPARIATPRQAADAIEKAIARLQPAGPKFNDRTKCNSCHNQNIPGIAISLAKAHGIHIDESLAGHSMRATTPGWKNRREAVLLGETNGGGFQPNISYGLLEMAEGRMPGDTVTDAMVLGLSTRQSADGSWSSNADIRPPLTGSAITSTALAIRALTTYAPPSRADEMRAKASRGLDFIRQATPRDTQDRAFELLGLVWGGATAAEIAAARDSLIALQRTDGGFGQLPTLDADAYATGQALYALHAAGVRAGDAVYKRGADYLLRTQLEDGTWFVRTRAFGFQPYFETGFPHGRSQFISTVATSWASIALTYTLE